MKKIVILTLFMISACAVQQTPTTHSPLKDLVENLHDAYFLPVREGWQFDYGFREGWMWNKYEYVRSLISYRDFQELFQNRIYTSGPHTRNDLDLNANYQFGHYNPEFLLEFRGVLAEIVKDKEFIRITKPLLEKYDLVNALKKHKAIYAMTVQYPEEFQGIKEAYAQAIRSKTLEPGAYRTMVPQRLNSEMYWNWSESSYHFWVRRDLDNTKQHWIALIDDVLRAYGELR